MTKFERGPLHRPARARYVLSDSRAAANCDWNIGRVKIPSLSREEALAAIAFALHVHSYEERIEIVFETGGHERSIFEISSGSTFGDLVRSAGQRLSAPSGETAGFVVREIRGTDSEIRRVDSDPDLILGLKCIPGGVEVSACYDRSRFSDDLVCGLLRLIASISGTSPDAPLAALELDRSPASIARRSVPYPSDIGIHRIFEEVAARSPDAIALVSGQQSMDYRSLNQLASRISGGLSERGVKAGDRVALLLERSFEQVALLLAISKLGAVYVPLDPGYPKQRISQMLTDCAAEMLIVSGESGLSGGPETVTLAEASSFAGDPPEMSFPSRGGDPFYVMYTSGSTGKPKGIEICHRAVARLVFGNDYMRFGPRMRMLHAAPSAFDASTLELWAPLLHGGACVLYPGNVPSGWEIRSCIEEGDVTSMWLTAALFNAVVDEDPAILSSLEELIIGGEALSAPHVAKFVAAAPAVRLSNGYGPTECTTFATTQLVSEEMARSGQIPIGLPINATSTLIVDRCGKIVPRGAVGELLIGGDGLANGYVGNPEMTAERFVESPLGDGERLYRSGDLARMRPDGSVEYHGRIDQQIKIAGHRIEPAEIESVLISHPHVEQAAVVARDGVKGKELVAYVVGAAGSPGEDEDLVSHMGQSLPRQMVPRKIVWLDSLPRTPTGKVDRAALPAPAERCSSGSGVRPGAVLEIFRELTGNPSLDSDTNFFDGGGSSILAVRAVGEIRKRLGFEVAVTRIFEKPTARAFEASLSGEGSRAGRGAMGRPGADIAVVGIALRAPGANSVEALWDMLMEGREGTSYFADSELDPSVPRALRERPDYVKARGIVEDADCFDNELFGVTPAEAEIMDPQHRVFLEICLAALEDAGHPPSGFPGAIGVFAGSYYNTYLRNAGADAQSKLGALQIMLANDKDFVTTRVAHKLNLRGPAVTVQCGCSTSLVAIAQARASLLSGDCDMAIAGGVSITVPMKSGHLYQEGGMLSPDGRCKPFDADGRGTIFSDGAAVVALRRLEDAVDDGDRIYAVIKGAALNNDGSEKASFTAPSVSGQAEVIARALSVAGIRPHDLSFVEAHGTGTPLGDPIEVEALRQVFACDPRREERCALGSVKSNTGHLVIAAGVMGFIKACLALQRRILPGTLHFRTPNPHIAWSDSPFFVNAQPIPLERKSLYAGVSSFGVGGTNAHVVLSAPPPAMPRDDEVVARPLPLVMSASSEDALSEVAARLASRLENDGGPEIPDVAITLATGREPRKLRSFVVAESRESAVAALRKPPRSARARKRDVLFMFPGQGAQYAGMGGALYDSEPAFRADIDRCSEILAPKLGLDLREAVFSLRASEAPSNTLLVQPSIFVMGYALARLWQSFGVAPSALVGHSVGELAAATLAGVFALEDALTVVAFRSRMMAELPGGSMLAVRTAAESLGVLPRGLDLAAMNGPELCVVAGPEDLVEEYRTALARKGINAKTLNTSHAFHSRMVDPIVEPLREMIGGLPLAEPELPIYSTVTGALLTARDAKSPEYWATHARKPVRFRDAAALLASRGEYLCIETGPGSTLCSLVRQSAKNGELHTTASLHCTTATEERTAFARALGDAWCSGAAIDWYAALSSSGGRKCSLPSYPFARKRFWMGAGKSEAQDVIFEERKMETQIRSELFAIMEDISGHDIEAVEGATFLELGLDSLSLTQAAALINERFGVSIAFRQLLEDLSTFETLGEYLAEKAPKKPAASPTAPSAPVTVVRTGPAPVVGLPAASTGLAFRQPVSCPAPDGSLQSVVNMQLELMSRQLSLLEASYGGSLPSQPSQPEAELPPELAATPSPQPAPASNEEKPKKSFGAGAKIRLERSEDLTPAQHDYIRELAARYNRRTAESKRQAQLHRAHLADPRTVSGFRPILKEMTYPIVVDRSKGSKLWDVDGNEYIDLTCGFGSNFLGNLPEIVTEAVRTQLERGIEIGPQHPLAGQVAALICELTGADRAAFASTGSEAVLGAMRLARTVTGKKTIVTFTGAYHGIFDEVIVRESKNRRAIAAAPGIMQSAVDNVWVLEWGAQQSLDLIRANANELAAVMVESVQSRRPDVQPKEFLMELRQITEACGAALVFDEIVTGFRVHPGGAQAHFGIRADLATYGKVVGGGLPIGVIAGRKRFMDALDGGFWSFGDSSFPEVGVTYFAGTFVRHPLALAAAKVVLEHLKREGPSLQQRVADMMGGLASRLNAFFQASGCGLTLPHFTSFSKLQAADTIGYPELLYVLLREKGLHIWDGRPCFLTTSHNQEDIDAVVRVFEQCVSELQAQQLLPGRAKSAELPAGVTMADEPPVPGARLGRDPQGNPGWYVPDPERQGKFIMLSQIN